MKGHTMNISAKLSAGVWFTSHRDSQGVVRFGTFIARGETRETIAARHAARFGIAEYAVVDTLPVRAMARA